MTATPAIIEPGQLPALTAVAQSALDQAQLAFGGTADVKVVGWGQVYRDANGRKSREYPGFTGDVLGFRWSRRQVVVMMGEHPRVRVQLGNGRVFTGFTSNRFVALRHCQAAIERSMARAARARRDKARKGKPGRKGQ